MFYRVNGFPIKQGTLIKRFLLSSLVLLKESY